MSTLASVLEIGKSSLRSQQIGLSVAGNNIANVNTPGYARKNTILQTRATVGGVGTGVHLASLTRARDSLLDSQFRFEEGALGRLEALERAMTTIEAVFSEMAGGGTTETGAVFNQPGGAILSGAFSRFFNAFQDLANNPESLATRAAVREEGVFLAEQFHRIHDQLSRLRTDLDREVGETVEEINRLTRQIANMNVKILEASKGGTESAGDLVDERDRQIDELAQLVNVSVRDQTDGTVTVTAVGARGALLVDRAHHSDLSTRSVVRDGAAVLDISLASSGEAVVVSSGKLKGLMDARDEKITGFQSSLDTLAGTLVTRVNTIHAGGFGLDGTTGTVFFEETLTAARDIAVSEAVLNDLQKVAAAGPSDASPSVSAGSGEGSVALALTDLRLEKVLGGGTQTIEEFYADLVGQVGAEAKGVFTDTEGQRLVMEQLAFRREGVRGVSINEEATSLILFQRAYQAATRIVTMVDEMMQSALNM